jgi:hypothetical protein
MARPRETDLRVLQSNWWGKLLTLKWKSSVRDLPLPAILSEMLQAYGQRWRSNPLRLVIANAKGHPITSCYVGRGIVRVGYIADL